MSDEQCVHVLWTVAGYFARIVTGKSIGLFVRAAARIQQAMAVAQAGQAVKFFVAGGGDEAVINTMRGLAGALGVGQVRRLATHE